MDNPAMTTLDAVRAIYSGAEGELWELLMGQQIHIGGFKATCDLAARAGIAAGMQGVDLCCCNGAGMRVLVRFCEVAAMTGVDATAAVVTRGQARTAAEGLAARITHLNADACASGLPDASADFVWGEDAWCYVDDKARLIAEAVRIVRPGGVIAFTDWVAGPTPMDAAERARLLRFMSFPDVEDIGGYRALLEAAGAAVEVAEDTGRFASHVALYLDMVDRQLTYDALRLLDFKPDMLAAIGAEMQYLHALGVAGKLVQVRFIARRR